MTTFEELKASAVAPQVTVKLCLRGDLHDERARAVRALAAVKADQADEASTFAVSPEVERARDMLAGIDEQMREHTFDFTFRAMPGREYRALEDEFPPDAKTGEFSPAFLTELVCRCLTDPVLTPVQLDELGLTAGQLSELESAALQVNRDTSVPF